ncbi:TetR family transcriptional regulator [Amycolatopsis antarctica]|uniref:TetR family transcriptional regulator n=1 Tax=Amycolatopsis antarctica TaxID=1854586 RepID=A0A263CZW0_9PSEU|nr:TetR/AcrR family transcriptional regulator [Amycolatopsis antarctica]OZM71418.1 TetR family transcriptional regulator [Amycolatopsis antarctica]
MAKSSARERVLDAYEAILIEGGVDAVTLDAVAARAEVSKGGLLYHFGSKEALLQGLLDRMHALYDADLEAARSAPEGVVAYYLQTSVSEVTENSALHRATLALVPLAMADPRVGTAVRECNGRWRTLLHEHVRDPLSADLLAVIGDGLYLRAAIGDHSAELSSDWPGVLRRLGIEA